jgi:hypothetical protein
MDKDFEERGLDRRSFIKGAAFAGAAAVTVGALAACGQEAPAAAGGDGAATAPPAGNSPATPSGKTPGGTIVAEDWLGEPPVVNDADITETLDFDVVILGGGHTGTQAACAAAQLGATVAVVEQQEEDSYGYFGDDICSYNSKFLTARGFGGYDTGEIVSEFVRRGNGRVNPDIIRLFVENSGEMMDNMVSLIPETSNLLDFDDFQCIIQTAYGKDSGTDYPIEVAGYKSWATTVQTIGTTNPTPVNGREGLSRLTEIETYVMLEAQRLGAQWFWGHSAVNVVKEGDAVTGAIAQKADGSYIKLNAKKGVLLALGDFAGDPDMVYNLLDDVNEWGTRVGQDRTELGGPGRAGFGQKIGCWAGGGIEPHPRPSMNIMGGVPGPWGTTPFLVMNGLGKRFMNEAMASNMGPACLRQPLLFTTIVTDSNFMKSVQLAGLDHGAPNWGAPTFLAEMEEKVKAITPGPEPGEVPGVAIINVRMSGFGGSQVFAANTIEELLGYLGYSGESLQTALASVARYNELCAKHHDDDYGKDADVMVAIDTPPFYGATAPATGTGSAGLVTLTGLLTDTNLNVMKVDRSGPIKGLYASGNCLGQRYGNAYSTPSAGNSMGMAMTHGRVAGKIIASL